MSNMQLIGEYMTQLETPQAFWAFVYKMAARGHFVFPSDAKNHKVLVIWDLNGYGEYEFDWCICDKIMACTIVGVRRRRRNQEYNTPKKFKFRGYNYHNAILQIDIQVPTAIFILHLKRNIPYFKPHNLISNILHPQITSPTFYTPISHLPHCFPISHLPHIFTPNLPPPTFFYPQSPTSHFLCHPPPVIDKMIKNLYQLYQK